MMPLGGPKEHLSDELKIYSARYREATKATVEAEQWASVKKTLFDAAVAFAKALRESIEKDWSNRAGGSG
jgi:hypothetical protein